MRAERRGSQPGTDGADVRPDVKIAIRAAEQWGVLSLDELRACGLSRDGVWMRVRGGRLHPIHTAVYAVGYPVLTLEGRFTAATKACGPASVLSHYSAAALWGFVAWDDRHPEVTVPGDSARAHPGVRVHRSRLLLPGHLTRRQGIPVTSAARTLSDLAAVIPYRGLRRAVREALALGRVTLGELTEVLHSLGPRRGSRSLAQVLADTPVATRSVLEDAVLDLIRRGGLETPDVNVPLVLGGRRVVPDFRWPEQRLIVEADGATWHSGLIARDDDAERQALLESHGERVVRVTWAQTIGDPRQTLARITAAGAPRIGAAVRVAGVSLEG